VRFEPQAPDESVNVSPQHPLKEAAYLTVGLAALVVLVVVAIAQGVDLVAPRIPPEVERRVFASLASEFAGQVDADAELAARVAHAQHLVVRLLAHWPDAPMQYRVGLLASSESNAAALPGGWILVTKGLLRDVRTENELAFVLAHELGHFRNRDQLRRLGRGVVYGLAIATLARSSGPALDLATLVGELTARGFDREQETAADLFGLELVYAEYGHVACAGDFFERRRRQEESLGDLAAYLSTHPGSESRANELRERARRRGWAVEGTPVVLEMAH